MDFLLQSISDEGILREVICLVGSSLQKNTKKKGQSGITNEIKDFFLF